MTCLYKDSNGATVDAIHSLPDGTDVDGTVYEVEAGDYQTTLLFQQGQPAVHGLNGLSSTLLLAVLKDVLTLELHQEPSEELRMAKGNVSEALSLLEKRDRAKYKIVG